MISVDMKNILQVIENFDLLMHEFHRNISRRAFKGICVRTAYVTPLNVFIYLLSLLSKNFVLYADVATCPDIFTYIAYDIT